MSGEGSSVSDKSERDEWLGIELRHLAALATVAQEASFSGAADSLGYVQSAISQQISSLERIVGQRLVDRSARPRSVAVTPAGRTLLEHVDAILEQLRLTKADIDALTQQSQLAVSFGVDARVGGWLDAALVGSMIADPERPSWDRIERQSSAELLRLVADGRLDAAFVELPIASGPFFALELQREAYVLAAPAVGGAAGHTAETVLAQWPLVAIEGCSATAALLRRRRSVGGAASAYSASGSQPALALVRAGVATAVATVNDVSHDDPAVTTVPLPDLSPRVVGMAWHRDRDDRPEVVALRAAASHALMRTE